jgi:AcrR family transcriptional regulator
MDQDIARTRVLDTAEELFYARGIQAVGMDQLRDGCGVSLKRLYQLFPAKEQLVEAYLERRDVRWRAQLADYVAGRDTDAEGRILAVFDWLRSWFRKPGFRGCAWINSYGELGGTTPGLVRQARRHKSAFKRYLRDLVRAAGLPDSVVEPIYLLAEGAMVTAGITGRPDSATHAKEAASVVIAAARAAST